jgi:carboxylesterase type B
MCWRPVICDNDKTFSFKSQPINAVPGKPLIIGTNKNEGVMFVALIEEALAKSLEMKVEDFRKMSAADFEKLIHLLFKDKAPMIHKPVKDKHHKILKGLDRDSESFFFSLFARIITEFTFTCGNLKYDFNAAAKGSGLFAYYFTHISSCNPVPTIPQCRDYVCHSAELPYVFHTFAAFNPECTDPNNPHKLKPAEYQLSRQMIGFWTGFAAGREPGSSWPKFASEPLMAQLFELTINPKPTLAYSVAAKDLCLVWLPLVDWFNIVKCPGD